VIQLPFCLANVSDADAFPFSLSTTMPNSTRALYADRPEWSDVIPLKQYEGATPVAPIFYTDECAL
jgi:hypothetical protein